MQKLRNIPATRQKHILKILHKDETKMKSTQPILITILIVCIIYMEAWMGLAALTGQDNIDGTHLLIYTIGAVGSLTGLIFGGLYLAATTENKAAKIFGILCFIIGIIMTMSLPS